MAARARWTCIVFAAVLGGVLAGCVPDPVDVTAQCPPGVCDPALSFVYARVSIAGGQFIQAFTVHPETGALTPVGAPVPTASDGNGRAQQLAVSPDGKYVFSVKRNTPGTIESFAIRAGGTLALTDSLPVVGALRQIAAAPGVDHVYATDVGDPLPPGKGLTEFALSSDGRLTAAGSVSQRISGLAVHPDGNFIFTGNVSGSRIGIVQAIDGGGILDSGVTIDLGGVSAPDVAMDPLGEFVIGFANGLTPPKIGLLRFNAAGPALTLLNPPVADLPCAFNSAAGTFDPTGQFLYVICGSGPVNPIFQLEGRDTAPVLTLVDQVSLPALPTQNGFGIAIPRSGKFLYSAANNRPAIDGFSIDPATGILSPLPGSPFDVTGLADFLFGPLAAY